MSDRSDLAKLELILKYISDIEKIIERHGSIEQVIEDFESQYAVMMCLIQIAETVNKISFQEYISKLPLKKIWDLKTE